MHFHNYNVLVFDTFSVKSKNILAVFFALQRSIISTGLEHVVDTTLYLWKGQVDMKSNIIWEWIREEEKKDIFDSYRSNLIDKSFAWFLCNLEENTILTVRSLFILVLCPLLTKSILSIARAERKSESNVSWWLIRCNARILLLLCCHHFWYSLQQHVFSLMFFSIPYQ